MLDKHFIFYRIGNRKEGKEERREATREGGTGTEQNTGFSYRITLLIWVGCLLIRESDTREDMVQNK